MSGRGGNNYRPWRGRGNRGSRGFRGSRRPYSYGPPGGRHSYNGNKSEWRKEEKPAGARGLTEKEIGVTEYVSEHDGFNGIIKSRFSDFQVSEVNENGEIAKLTDLSPPEPPEDETVLEDEDLLLNKYNLEILPMETWDRINKLAMSTGPDYDTVEVDVTGMSKEERTKIHDAVKKAFGEGIVGSTVTRDEKKYCTFVKYRKGVRVDNRVKWVWPGEYVRFIVYKENCDTMEAASRIIKQLRMNASLKPSMVGYAGTKDRRAKTSQWFSLRKVDPRKIAAACKGLPDIKVGNYTFSNAHLKLGMLQGNRFRICLRNVTESDETIDTACKQLQDNGFINYYGLQRFGSRSSVPTHVVGLHLLRGNFEEAIRSILEERAGPLAGALRAFHSSGAEAAAALLPRRAPHCAAEARLVHALAQRPAHPAHPAHALAAVPRNTRLLYLHSYQSLIWNKVVSERLKRFSYKPAVGDLVPLEEIEEDTVEEDDSSTLDDIEQEELEKAEKKEERNVPKKIPRVKTLTQEDVDSGKYTIFDIVLPLPGHSVEYPPNVKEYYEELLTKDGLTLKMKHKIKEYSLCGGYRHALVRARSVSWRSVRYDDPFADLFLSDADEIAGKKDTGEVKDGKYKALLITMILPTSVYATMALRELLRVDTSSDTQAQQNNYHKKHANEENIKQENVNEENVKQENVNKENVSEENSKPENIKQENSKPENVKQENIKQENNVEKGNEDGAEKRKGDDDSENGDCKKAKMNDE